MKTNVVLALFTAAISIPAFSTPSFARSADAIVLDSTTTESVERADLSAHVDEAFATDSSRPAPTTEALAGAKAKMKHAWNSVKKGTSNLLGKRVKHMGKHSTRAGMQSKKGRENVVDFLHGGKKPARRHSI
jgi:hypothetical protein